MFDYDIVILTDPRYLHPKNTNGYIANVLLEDQLVADALEALGLKTTRKAWDDPDFDWNLTQYALFRATWDYFDRFAEFKDWFESTAQCTTFINSQNLIHWNIDKHYLFDLRDKGIAIPKTLLLEAQTDTTLAAALQKAKKELHFGGQDFILKPCVAGGARHTYKFHEDEVHKHEAIFKELISKEALLLQEFQENIVTKGEISMMVFKGSFTHAVLKIAKKGDFRVQDDFGGSVHDYEPSKAEIDFAHAVVHACDELPLYARVDIFEANEGGLALAELEIFEPELWFRNHPEAAKTMAMAIKETYFS